MASTGLLKYTMMSHAGMVGHGSVLFVDTVARTERRRLTAILYVTCRGPRRKVLIAHLVM